MGQEVRATPEDDDLIAIPPPDEAEVVGLPAEDSREAYVRNTAVMSVGTALSRLTGFLRLSLPTRCGWARTVWPSCSPMVLDGWRSRCRSKS